jgi:hypothetical protein
MKTACHAYLDTLSLGIVGGSICVAFGLMVAGRVHYRKYSDYQ